MALCRFLLCVDFILHLFSSKTLILILFKGVKQLKIT